MGLLIDLVLVACGVTLLQRSRSEGDEVWCLFLRGLATIDLAMVTLGSGTLAMELAFLGAALALPSLARLDRGQSEP